MYIVVKTREFSKNNINIINIELKQLKLHLLPHGVTLCITYSDDLQTGAEDGWVLHL